MTDLVDFLNARLDEDEAVARAASPGGWSYPGIESVAGGLLYDADRTIAQITWDNPGDHDGSIVRFLPWDEADANGAHIARHDPARVLAEVQAKRRIVDLHRATLGEGAYCAECDTHVQYPCRTLRLMALPYSDHPSYRAEEWTP